MTRPLRWIRSNGGPMVLIPRQAVSEWRGHCGTSEANEELLTDYGRACQIEDFLGLIECGGHQVLVVGDEPAQITWLPCLLSGGIIAKWTYAPDIESAEASLRHLSEPEVIGSLPWHRQILLLPIKDTHLLLFDAGINGRNLEAANFIEIPVGSGIAEIKTAIYEPAEGISFVLHGIGALKLM